MKILIVTGGKIDIDFALTFLHDKTFDCIIEQRITKNIVTMFNLDSHLLKIPSKPVQNLFKSRSNPFKSRIKPLHRLQSTPVSLAASSTSSLRIPSRYFCVTVMCSCPIRRERL